VSDSDRQVLHLSVKTNRLSVFKMIAMLTTVCMLKVYRSGLSLVEIHRSFIVHYRLLVNSQYSLGIINQFLLYNKFNLSIIITLFLHKIICG